LAVIESSPDNGLGSLLATGIVREAAMPEGSGTLGAEETLHIFRDAVEGIVRIASAFSEDDWSRPTSCSEWCAGELAAHLRTTAARYHDDLDQAVAGTPAAVHTGVDLAQLNARMVNAVAPDSGFEHIEVFQELALTYAERLPAVWDVRPFTSGWSASVGEAAGAMAIEWHVHAWDLARSVARDYRPESTTTLASAWQVSLAPFFSVAVPDGDAWDALLLLYSRELDW
jgi:uncharacterized protein (TIGR03083 family)